MPQDEQALRLLMNVFALQGVQGYRVQLGSNPALWSTGYEFCFYLFHGLLFFQKTLFRRQWVAALIFVAAAAAVGWKMILYFAVWLLGVLAYRLSRISAFGSLKGSNFVLLLLLVVTNRFILLEIFQDFLFAFVVAYPSAQPHLSTRPASSRIPACT